MFSYNSHSNCLRFLICDNIKAFYEFETFVIKKENIYRSKIIKTINV